MFQQIAIVVGGILGLFILYFVARHILASISPETDEKIELYFILKDVKRHFGFLFEKGYKIREAHYSINPNGSWHVDIESKECVVSIVQDRSEISAYVSPKLGSNTLGNQISLEALIYLQSNGKNIIDSYEGNLAWGKQKQLERLAGLLKRYADQIASYFGSNFHYDKSVFRNAEQEYSSTVSNRRRNK